MATNSGSNRHAISFQSGLLNSSIGIMVPDNYTDIKDFEGIPPVGAANSVGIIQPGTSYGNLSDPVSGLRHETDLASDWSIEELFILEQGFVKYANETPIMKYIKIAAQLPDKTVRDVALRCRWMTKKENGKRRKSDEYYTGKKIKDKKDKMVAPSTNPNLFPALLQNMTSSFSSQSIGCNWSMQYEAPAGSSTTMHLLDENLQVFNQISSNLAAFKVQENVDLLYRSMTNINAILNEMQMSPSMSQMPDLRVHIDVDLASIIFPSKQILIHHDIPNEMNLKQESRY